MASSNPASQQNANYEIDSIVQKMETLNATKEDLEAGEMTRRFESIGEVHEDGVEVAVEAMEDLGIESAQGAAAKQVDLKDRFKKFTDDEWQMQYVDFLKREDPQDFPTMRFDVRPFAFILACFE